mgnify:CR=1 FL=1
MRFKDKRLLNIRTPEDMLRILEEKGNPMSSFKKGTRVHAYNHLQTDYSYVLSENPGENFDPEFKPAFTPQQMLEMGVFEGRYINTALLEFGKEIFMTALKKGKVQATFLQYRPWEPEISAIKKVQYAIEIE